MKSRNKYHCLVFSSTFVGLICGLVLTHQQAYAAQTPPVSNQESQITAVTASDNNLTKATAVNQDYSAENISTSAVSDHVTPSTYSSPETGLAAEQQPASSDSTAAVATPNTGATGPAVNGTASSTNPENNNSTNPVTSSPSPDTGNSASTPVAASDNQTNGDSNTTSVSSEQPDTNIIAQGTWGTSKWDYTQEGADYILHLHAGTLGTPKENEGIGSLNEAFEQQLTQIVIDSGVVANQNSSGLFRNLKHLQTVQGLENLDASQVTNMSRMFEYCESLTKLDLGSWNTSNVENMSWMFNECTNLIELNLDNWDTLKVNYDGLYAMLNHCKSLSKLVLGPKTILTSALLPDVPEIGTKVSGTDKTVTASCWVATSGYQQGQRYTSTELMKIRDRDQATTYEWASQQNSNSDQPDNNIIAQGTWGTSKWDYTQKGADYILHLHAGILGTPKGNKGFGNLEGIGSLNAAFKDQLTQIVIDSGVVANQNSRGLFKNLKNLQTIQGLENMDTSHVTNMSEMFENCMNLTSLDVSHFNTARVLYLNYMFAECENLTSLDLSSFDTSQLINDYVDDFAVLEDCNNLHHLVLGPKIQLINQNGRNSSLPAVPAAGTKIPGTDKTVIAPYWVATSGYQQGNRYTSAELQQLTGRDQVTTYDWDSQAPYQETVESKSVTRTINVHYPDGQVKPIQDTVDLSRKVKVKADGSKTYGEWSTAQWKAYTVPELAGYQANQSKIPAQTVDSNTTDTTIDILYEPIAQTIVIQYLDQGQVVGTQKLIGYTGETLIPNYHAPQGYEIISSPQPNITVDATGTQIIQVNVSHKITQSAETLTKTRTINIHLPNATEKTYRQVAVIKRNVAVDQVTGSKTYGPWHNNSWDAMDIPIIEGYTANQNSIAAKEVTAETENETIDIFYVQN
ncbi:BspA family leucine-rich repeat surface protein [Lactobacillus mellis]|nr:BspA family leucine-rich repeat surface protein [Bombilactobacillus mellis]